MKRWTTADTVMASLITVLAGVLRKPGITWPPGFVFDEFYAGDACVYVFGSHPPCPTTVEVGIYHPPLGMWLIGLGERVFGFTPAGWRVAPLLAGTLSVLVLYLLARRLLGSTLAASIAAGLLAFDFLHFVLSRTAMLDIFVLCFGLTAFLCLLYDRDRSLAAAGRPWLIAAGVAGGAALACKWSGGYLLAGVLLLAVLYHRQTLRKEGGMLFATLVILPAVIYVASYAGRLEGTWLAWPWANGAWLRAFAARQYEMVAHHTGELYNHPYASPAWSWPFIRRPVLFTINDLGNGGYQEILALGNPLVWWPALAAFVVTAWRALRRREAQAPETVIVIGFLAGYLPWLILTRREAFLYYLLPALPFLYLGAAAVVERMARRPIRAAVIAALIVASVVPFAFFRPVLVGTPLSHPEWQKRILFRDCGPLAPGDSLKPVTQPVPSPTGWCWA